METIAVDSKNAFLLKQIEIDLGKHFEVEASCGDTVVVHKPGSRACLYVNDDASRLFLDNSDVGLAKSVLEIIAADPNYTVDNGFGTVLPGNQFVNRIKAEKHWDWRRGVQSGTQGDLGT
jgi:hypothetical protein